MIAQNKNISDVSVTSSRQKLRLLSSRKGKAVSIDTHKSDWIIHSTVSHFVLFSSSGLRPWQHEELKKMYRDSNFRKTRQKLNQLVDEDVWSNDTKGAFNLLLLF
jgi:hypothetical protein